MENEFILVAGGAGFIGSNLVKKLLELGFNVHVVDNLISGRKLNIEEFISNPKFNFEKIDITVDKILDINYKYIFHLASPASVPDYQNYPLETALANSKGTQNLLDLARKCNSRFLYTSTSEIYGDPKVHPQVENYWGNVNPVGPRSCYDESKRFGEMITTLYHNKFNVDTRIVRIFNTYGPKMRKNDGRVISNFINQALNGADITVYGDGSQTRSFCYIDDMINGLTKLMFTDNIAGEIVNIGNPNEISMLSLAREIIKMTGSKSQIIFKDLPIDDPKERKPDISHAKNILNWVPEINFIDGVTKTIEYYKLAKE